MDLPAFAELGMYNAAMELKDTRIEELGLYKYELEVLDNEIKAFQADYVDRFAADIDGNPADYWDQIEGWADQLLRHYRIIYDRAAMHVDEVEKELASEAVLARRMSRAGM